MIIPGKNTSNRRRMGALVLAIMLAAAGTALAEDNITRTFDVGYGGTLTLDTERGSIEVKTTSAKKVTVIITGKQRIGKRVNAEEILEEFDISFDKSGKDVTIEAESRHGRDWFGWDAGLRLHWDITVPEKYNLDLSTSGGSIAIADLEGDVECATSGGSLRISSIKGSIYGRTSGGSITLEGSEGTADLRTSGGGIDIGRVNGQVKAHTSGGSVYVEQAGGEVDVSTSGGSIRVREVHGALKAHTSGGSIVATITGQPKEDCSLKTSGGGVTVHLLKAAKVDVDAKTSGGNVSCDLPIMVQGLLGKTEVKGKINGGGPELYLRTSGGSIRIKEL